MFNAIVRFVFAAALPGTCFSISLASNADAADRNFRSAKQQGQIRVFNLAHVPKSALLRAEAEVTRVFAAADIDVHWTEGAPDDSTSLITDFSANNFSPTGGCQVAGHSHELRLRLTPRAPHGVMPGMLGFSLPCAKFGIDSTVFIDHCERVTYQTPIPFGIVLAYAMAHELGHVLLRSTEHSQTGLMRAVWDKNAWVRATVRGISLDRTEAARMRIELFRMESLSPAAPAG
jgi:hypothetical protein